MATSTSIARSIARSLRSEHRLPAPVLDKARLCLVDMVGISALAADLPASRQAARIAEHGSAAEIQRELDTIAESPDAGRLARLLDGEA